MRRLALLFLFLFAASSFAAGAPQLDAAMKEVEAVRERQFVRDVDQRTMKRDDLRAYLRDEIAQGARSAEDYRAILETMQFVDRDPQLIEKLLGLYEAQVLAFYDPRKHAYYSLDALPPGIAPNKVLDDVIAVHEFTHALQDQLFDAGKKLERVQDDWDRELAYHSVLEGEATLVMLGQLYRSAGQSLDAVVKDDALLASMMKAAEQAGGVPTDAPKFFVDSMKFPYLDGFRFVVAAYARGGWSAVDALHATPPISSEEILHPELYFARTSLHTESTPLPVDRKAYFSTRLGEFFWRELVGEDASRGADDSTFTITRDSKNRATAFVEARWDSADDAEHFASAYERFLYSRRFQPLIARNGRTVRVSYGPDEKRGKKFVAALQR